jgi:hypothetical protein
MPGVSPEALSGYILEEVLAYLLRNAGYRVLSDAAEDPEELENQHHGLVVKGRGADHQVDVLGELLWIPAFTFPLRLILEAKCRKGPTSIGTVRQMIAALFGHQSEQRAKTGSIIAVVASAGQIYVRWDNLFRIRLLVNGDGPRVSARCFPR